MAQLRSLRDEPNTQREYETIYILRGDTANDGVASVNTRIRAVIDQMGGKLLKVDNWGKRRLAYEVKKQLKGIYLYWHYLATPGVVEEVERNLRMLDSVIRYFTVKVDENVDVSARPSSVTDETFAKAAETAADEEEIMTGQARPGFATEEDEFDADAEEEALQRAAAEEDEEAAEGDEGEGTEEPGEGEDQE